MSKKPEPPYTWSIFATVQHGVDAQKIKEPKAIIEAVKGERTEHIEAAKLAAQSLIESGAVGPSGPWHVAISGIVTPKHKPHRDSYERITVEVERKMP